VKPLHVLWGGVVGMSWDADLRKVADPRDERVLAGLTFALHHATGMRAAASYQPDSLPRISIEACHSYQNGRRERIVYNRARSGNGSSTAFSVSLLRSLLQMESKYT
jgi:hypothetical protein